MVPLCLRSVHCAALDACSENMKDGTKGRTAEIESGTQTHSESVTEHNNNGWKQILHDVSFQHKPQRPRVTQRPNLIEANCERTNKEEQREETTAANAPSPPSSSSLSPVLPRPPHDTMSQVLSHYLNRKKRPFKPISSLHTIKESTATDSHHQHQPCEVATSPTDPEGWKRICMIQQQEKTTTTTTTTKSQQPTCTDKQKAMISQRYQTKYATFPIVRGTYMGPHIWGRMIALC